MERSRLRRPNYHFANVEIPLPSQGVSLLECRHCAMLFKSAVPTPEAWDRVMLDGATDVWRPKSGAHPGLPMMRSHINGARRTEGRRVGIECVRNGRLRGWPLYKKNTTNRQKKERI